MVTYSFLRFRIQKNLGSEPSLERKKISGSGLKQIRAAITGIQISSMKTRLKFSNKKQIFIKKKLSPVRLFWFSSAEIVIRVSDPGWDCFGSGLRLFRIRIEIVSDLDWDCFWSELRSFRIRIEIVSDPGWEQNTDSAHKKIVKIFQISLIL